VSKRLTLTQAACQVLAAPEPGEKVRLTYAFAESWRAGEIVDIGDSRPPDRPARPLKPELCSPALMPKRSSGLGKRRTALIHALAHIELNAIDLAWDIVARFTGEDWPRAFYDDWLQVAVDEAKHFEMLDTRLHELCAAYGDMTAHDGLWEAAQKTQSDILQRLSLVPMVLEARGLDTTPATVERLTQNGDSATAEILAIIAHDEISHVAAGVRWFEYVCEKRKLEPFSTFKTELSKNFNGHLKPPFHYAARDLANMSRNYYDE
jgi:uncharacterized ferritin-like protein (DUF455 family)